MAQDAGSIAPAGPPGLRFALLAHPSAQAVRFLTKLALPWFFTIEEFGEAALAGLIVFGVQHVAVAGLDEALVSARAVTGGLWRSMRRHQDRVALGLAAILIAVGFLMQLAPSQAFLGRLLIALAPMLWVANRGTLPTWLLVRERRFRDLFLIDMGSILAFTAATILSAEAGCGAWSLVVGWHANALASLAISSWRARDLVPRDTAVDQDWPTVRRAGTHLTGAAVLTYIGDRIDSGAVGFVLGRGPLGLFENAQNLAGLLVGYAQSLADRLLFPTLAAHARAQGLGASYLRALRYAVLFVVPAHILLALASDPLVTTVFPERWHPSAPLCRLLALAAAVRCFDLLAVTALKAAGQGAAVLRLGGLRLALLAAALVVFLPRGLEAVVAGVLVARALSAGCALGTAAVRLPLAADLGAAELGRAALALVTWAALFVPAAVWIERNPSPWAAPVRVAGLALCAALAWGLARLLCDRRELAGEWRAVRARIARGGRG